MGKKHSRFSWVWLVGTGVVVVAIAVVGVYNFAVLRPSCLTLTSTQPQQMGHPTNEGLLSLAHKLGAKDPIKICSSDINRHMSFDGYAAYVIRIPGVTADNVRALACPARPQSDPNNSRHVTYAHQAFRNKDEVTGFYSPEGASCHGDNAAVIMTARDTENEPAIYIVFTARRGSD